MDLWIPARRPHHVHMKYRQYCPVARAAEVLADRWTPLIIRELLAGSCHFNDIERGLPGISRTLLAGRLRLLEASGVLIRQAGTNPRATDYQLTPAGEDLRNVIDSFGAWGARWAFGEPRPQDLDPALILWKVHQRINRQLLPRGRVVVELEFDAARPRRFWLVLRRNEVSLCLKPSGFDSDLFVRGDLATFYAVWFGRVTFDAAVRAGDLGIEGPPALRRAFPTWLQGSPMASKVRAADAARG